MLVMFFRTDVAFAGGTIEARVDPRIEVLSIIQYLGDRLEMRPSSYSEAVEEHFSPYREHRAVDLVREMMDVDSLPIGVHSESSSLGLYLNEEFQLEHPLTAKDSAAYSRYYGYDRMLQLLRSVEDFARVSDFWSFRDEMKMNYQKWEQDIDAFLAGRSWAGEYGTFFNVERDWIIFLNPLKKVQSAHACDAYSQYHEGKNAFTFSFREPTSEDTVVFTKNERKWRDLIWHEGGHLITRDGTYIRYKDDLTRYKKQFSLCKERIAKTKGYRNWERYIDEAIAYGIALYQLADEDAAWFEIKRINMKLQGFLHTDIVLESLEEYEQHHQGEDFRDAFYPILLRNLEKAEEQGTASLKVDYQELQKKGRKLLEEYREGQG